MVESSYSPPTTTTTTTTTTSTTTTAPPSDVVWGSGEGSGEGSGWAAGEEMSPGDDSYEKLLSPAGSPPLVYDEIILQEEANQILPSDDAQPTDTQFHELCTCKNNQTCSENGSVAVDAFLSLSFCGGVEAAVPRFCRGGGGRAIGRVIGDLATSASVVDPFKTRTMESYNSARLFCRCPGGQKLSRLPRIEPWPAQSAWAFPFVCQ